MRLVKHIPNTITSMNLLFGIFGVIVCLQGRPDQAFLLMLAAAVCDFCDGLAARALHAYSDIGKELDSLADLVRSALLLWMSFTSSRVLFWNRFHMRS